MAHLWKGYEHSFRPIEFKDNLGHVIHRFSSFSQQDSHEFLSLFLDNLHEDLNRISNKPYIDLEEQKKMKQMNKQVNVGGVITKNVKIQ